LREFRVRGTDAPALEVGQTVGVDQFAVGDMVTVVGTSKGKGFAGVVKRHHFRGHPRTHGHKDALRKPGSIGAGGVQHVPKGRRMAGHMGNERVTVKNLRIVAIDPSVNTITVSGAVPGARNSLVMIRANS
jgi:large subunit ribosomal protein L3